MKQFVMWGLAFVVGVAVGAGGIIKGFPALLSKRPAPIVVAAPYNPAKAVPVSFSSLQSNLAGGGHYINFSITFSVMPAALSTLGGKPSAGGSGTSGTGNPDLDARIQNALLNLARSTSYATLNAPGGMSTFKSEASLVLQSIFGPDTIGHIYFPTFLTQ